MPKFKVNVSPYEGEYDLDLEDAFTTVEWRWIKKLSGYMPLTINEGLNGGDPDLYVALVVVAMLRCGKIEQAQAAELAADLAEVPFDGAAITVTEDADPAPLPEQAQPESATA